MLQSSPVPPLHPSSRPPALHHRWKTVLAIAVLAVLALAVGARFVPILVARASLPTGEAQWIWKKVGRNSKGPLAFYAVRDFELEKVPDRARLLAVADEEYILSLNGKRVGSGAYRPDGRLDVYEVGPLLRPGGNRLIAELRSGRGAGGFLARLEDAGSGEPLVWSDERWQLFDRYRAGLFRGWLPLGKGSGGEPAFCWGYPPTGRWGKPTASPEKPLFAALTQGASPLPGASGGGRLPGFDLRGPRVVFDWGREVTGYLSLDLPPGETQGVGLLFTGTAMPDPSRDPGAAVLIVPGSPTWQDARPRRFRYAVILGLERPLRARVRPVDATRVAPLLANPDPTYSEDGVLGIEPPPLRTPVEDEVWRKFQRVPRVAGREEL